MIFQNLGAENRLMFHLEGGIRAARVETIDERAPEVIQDAGNYPGTTYQQHIRKHKNT